MTSPCPRPSARAGARRALAMAALLLAAAACGGPGEERYPSRRTDTEGPAWRSLAPAPTPRTEVAATAVNQRIVVAGGFAETGKGVPTVEVYDAAADRWEPGPDLPLALHHAMAASSDGVAFVFGGYAGGLGEAPSDRAFALEDGAWRELPAMPEPRAAGGATALDGRIYVAGGVGPSGLAGSTLVLDVAAERWTSMAGLATPREHLGVTAGGGRVFAVAGRVGGLQGNLATVEALDPTTGEWTGLPEVPTPRGGLGATFVEGQVVAIGGEAEVTFEEVEVFDVEEGRWSAGPPLPTPRHGLGVVAVGSVVYALLGGPEPGLTVSGAVEALDVATL